MIGRSLGPYRIDSALGTGGMGVVYRATDTQLNRAVALKLLPESVSRDPERVARLRREAQTLAALNHPNVAQVYGLVDTGEALALAMELVEGEDLAAVLARGALPLGEALAIARQIADALAAAHDQGIVHRDLKPANVVLRLDGAVKVLDFGLAKALEPAGAVSGDALTLTSPAMTAHGVILGTASYMAPEQARGKPVDRRADVWAFGVVLWEMLTGARLFPGETVSDTLAAVLTREPDLSSVPARVRPLLAACLQKDPKLRLRDVGDAWLLLPEEPASARGARPRAVIPWTLAALAAGALGAWALAALRPRSAPVPPTTFLEPPPPGTVFAAAPVPSPDGRALALLVKTASGETRLYTRDLASEAARPVDGSDGAELVFWSPDAAQLAFVAGGEVRRAGRAGGSSSLVTAAAPSGGVWLPDGDLLLAVPGQGLVRVPASGGAPRRVAGFDEAAFREQQFFDLAVSPEGSILLYRQFGGETGIYASRLDGSRRRLLYPGEQYAAWFVGARRLLRRHENVLLAQGFDPGSLSAVGDAVPVAKGVDRDGYAASVGGVVSFLAGGAETSHLSWFDRSGKPLGLASPDGHYQEVAISRHGRWLAFSRQEAGNVDVWVQGLAGGAPSRLTSDADIDHLLAISEDERTLAWEAHAGGALNLMTRPADGSAPARLVRRWGKGGGPTGWTADGRFVLYTSEETSGTTVFAVPAEGGEPVPLLPPGTRGGQAQISPDGSLVAYAGDATGRSEIYLQALNGSRPEGGALRASEDGGRWPLWREDGGELFFLDRKDRLMAVELDAQARPSGAPNVGRSRSLAGAPRALFTVSSLRAAYYRPYAPAPDGQRFVAITAADAAPRAATVILSWDAQPPR